ncbi:hypothetical protein G6F57_018105 [Rhizopus arrhizus]|nr:hypothetical protein G6F57_018105 [Rhizopus arrhizus]
MQHREVARIVQQRAGVAGAVRQDAALRLGHGPQFHEPFFQAAQRRQRFDARGVQRLEHAAKDARGLVVAARAGVGRQRARAGGAFQQDGAVVVCQHAGRALAVPPRHQHAALAFVFFDRDL